MKTLVSLVFLASLRGCLGDIYDPLDIQSVEPMGGASCVGTAINDTSSDWNTLNLTVPIAYDIERRLTRGDAFVERTETHSCETVIRVENLPAGYEFTIQDVVQHGEVFFRFGTDYDIQMIVYYIDPADEQRVPQILAVINTDPTWRAVDGMLALQNEYFDATSKPQTPDIVSPCFTRQNSTLEIGVSYVVTRNYDQVTLSMTNWDPIFLDPGVVFDTSVQLGWYRCDGGEMTEVEEAEEMEDEEEE